jgi:CheY-like chemotaxis protein
MSASDFPGLAGRQVFLVEDEAMVAMMIEDMLQDLGCVLAGCAGTLRGALAKVTALSEFDIAVLDVNLGGENVYPVADLLQSRGVPFIFSTAYGVADHAERYPKSRTLQKPYGPPALASMLSDVLVAKH